MPSCFVSSNTIRQLVDGKWVDIGALTRARRDCLLVSPLPKKMLIVGGWKDHTVEKCLVINPRRACAARVTVLGLCICVSVSVCVCVSVSTYSRTTGTKPAHERYQRL